MNAIAAVVSDIDRVVSWDAVPGSLYPDVAAILRRWSTGGVRLYTFSPVPVEAQRLLFGQSHLGDLTRLFAGLFGVSSGSAGYAAISRVAHLPPGEMLFLSSAAAALDAASQVGLQTCQLVRTSDIPIATGHATARDFTDVAAQFGLPGAPTFREAALIQGDRP